VMIIYGKMKYKKSIQEVQVHEPIRVWLGILANQATSVAVIIIVGPLAPCGSACSYSITPGSMDDS
jgi:hypothetical protein